ncbi:hypothetical protein Dimus_023273 [Dionaea muscipula]
MKDHQLQTPHRDISNRRSKDSSSKSTPDLSKKKSVSLPQLVKKNLKSAFASVSGDPLLESIGDFSPASEVSDANQKPEFIELISESVSDYSPVFEVSNTNEKKQASIELIAGYSETSTSSDLTSYEKVTSVADELSSVALDRGEISVFDGVNVGSVEADVVAYHLRRAGIQILRSKDVDEGVKKLLDALIDVMLKEIYVVPGDQKEKDRVESIVSAKACVVLVCFLLWLVGMTMVVVISGTGDLHASQIPPT